MPGYTLNGIADYVRTFNGTAQAVWSTPNAAGDLIVCVTDDYGGAPTPATPAGYGANITPKVNAQSIAVFLRHAVAANEALPILQWGGSTTTTGAFSLTPVGGALPSLAAIMSFIAANRVDRGSVNTTIIQYWSLPIATDNCMAVLYGRRLKTSTTDAATLGNITPDVAFGAPAPLGNVRGAGFSTFESVNLWQQTSATALSVNNQFVSAPDTNDNFQSVSFFIPPPIPIISNILYVRRMQRRISTLFYPR
jgi:hypothetical protein